jgi:antitoxin CcdA
MLLKGAVCAYNAHHSIHKGIVLRITPSQSRSTHKRAVNLTLSEPLVAQTKLYSTNLSATVEMLLTNYVNEQSKINEQKIHAAQRLSKQWNLINDQIGSFADEYSSL